MVCSSLFIGAFYLPLVAAKIWWPQLFSRYTTVCILMDGMAGYTILSHLLNSCLTSVWNYCYTKWPLRAMGLLTPRKITCTILSIWIFMFVYIFVYIMTISRHADFSESGCLTVFYTVSRWFILLTCYGIMLPSVVIIIVVNTGFLHLAWMFRTRQIERESRREHLRYSFENQQKANGETVECQENGIELDNMSEPPDEHIITSRRSRCGSRMAIFMFASIIAWLPTIFVANAIALGYDVVPAIMLEFISGVSHSISAVTPPIFFVVSAEGQNKMANVRRKMKMKNASI